MNPPENAAQRTALGSERGDLERALGLKEAVALNMIEMVGIGPFVVIPLVIKAMGGPQCLLAWAADWALRCRLLGAATFSFAKPTAPAAWVA